jgi:hypothetical protein
MKTWRTACALVVLVAVGLVSLTVDVACTQIPRELCNGASVNAKVGLGGGDDRRCSECVEATCCDLVGDCAKSDCANQVTNAHACVLDAGRRAAVEEEGCKAKAGVDDRQDNGNVYGCMRSHCGDQCGLPTCQLSSLVPPLGSPSCDHCFAQSCCSLMNECAQDRGCLIVLECIIERCAPAFPRELRKENHAAATQRRDDTCSGGGNFFVPDSAPPPGSDDATCFLGCIRDKLSANTAEAAHSRCLATQIDECGTDVDCGESCALPDASSDASTDAPVDASAD